MTMFYVFVFIFIFEGKHININKWSSWNSILKDVVNDCVNDVNLIAQGVKFYKYK